MPDNTAGVKVGTLIALMVSEGENWQDVMIPSSGTVEPASAHSEKAISKSEPISVTKSQKPQYVYRFIFYLLQNSFQAFYLHEAIFCKSFCLRAQKLWASSSQLARALPLR